MPEVLILVVIVSIVIALIKGVPYLVRAIEEFKRNKA